MLYALVVFVLVAPGIWLPHPEFLTFNTLEKCEEAVTSLTIDNVWKGLSDGLLQVKCFEYDNTQSRDQFILDINQDLHAEQYHQQVLSCPSAEESKATSC